jgi:hypothetical protein
MPWGSLKASKETVIAINGFAWKLACIMGVSFLAGGVILFIIRFALVGESYTGTLTSSTGLPVYAFALYSLIAGLLGIIAGLGSKNTAQLVDEGKFLQALGPLIAWGLLSVFSIGGLALLVEAGHIHILIQVETRE